MPHEEAEVVEKRTLDALNEQSSRADMWGIEVLKHLVIINGAGLAGTFTLYQVQGLPHSFWPTLSFLIGLAAAFLSLTMGWAFHRRVIEHFISGLSQFIQGSAGENFRLLAIAKVRWIFAAVMIFSVISGIAFFVGAISLYRLVTCA
ncbi:hypothetical protein [Pandoraea sputorum]|uniref:hypothetical protein n=1 Tax=Pandoraea sputorum TaxID=93222 RepID=UPI001240832C|nr:hypothetical protein [Pandoraea sputorum]VVE49912.1 hypothetical protein PSP20601_04610 [Pandoraea sputorum]